MLVIYLTPVASPSTTGRDGTWNIGSFVGASGFPLPCSLVCSAPPSMMTLPRRDPAPAPATLLLRLLGPLSWPLVRLSRRAGETLMLGRLNVVVVAEWGMLVAPVVSGDSAEAELFVHMRLAGGGGSGI